MQHSHEKALKQRRAMARRLNAELGKLSEISAVFVSGSVASGQVDERSDLDLFVVCRSTIPSVSERQSILTALGSGWRLQDQMQDLDGMLRRWREQIEPFAAQLQWNLLDHFSPLLRENVEELVANAERNLGPRVFLFRLNWAVDALIGMLFALNEIYDPADRRTERMILPTLNCAPSDFIARLTDVLEGPFDDEGAQYRARVFAQLAQEAIQLVCRRSDKG